MKNKSLISPFTFFINVYENQLYKVHDYMYYYIERIKKLALVLLQNN